MFNALPPRVINLSDSTINLLRDLSLEQFKKQDFRTSEELAMLCYLARPNEYTQERIARFSSLRKLRQLVSDKKIAFIPAGLRCTTSTFLKDNFSIVQPALPFDVGFFSPDSICSVLQNPVINLYYPDNYMTHRVCRMYFNVDEGYIKFVSSTYEDIEKMIVEDKDNINTYLDSSFAYYTLDVVHNYVLAHYNWHPLSSIEKSHGVTNPKENLRNVTDILNRRIERMFHIINSTEYVFFVNHNQGRFKFIMIDDNRFDLEVLSKLQNLITEKFGQGKIVVNSRDLSVDYIMSFFE